MPQKADPGYFPGSFALRDQASWTRRIRRRVSGRDGARPLRAGGLRLRPFDGAQPAGFPDLFIQRLLKAALAGSRPPYPNDELAALARHCTEQEDAAKKVERQVVKSAGAMLLSKRIGEKFDAMVTGASEKGTWVRIFSPPIEGRLVKGFAHRKVGDRLRAQLVFTDIERGYIDFAAA